VAVVVVVGEDDNRDGIKLAQHVIPVYALTG